MTISPVNRSSAISEKIVLWIPNGLEVWVRAGYISPCANGLKIRPMYLHIQFQWPIQSKTIMFFLPFLYNHRRRLSYNHTFSLQSLFFSYSHTWSVLAWLNTVKCLFLILSFPSSTEHLIFTIFQVINVFPINTAKQFAITISLFTFHIVVFL